LPPKVREALEERMAAAPRFPREIGSPAPEYQSAKVFLAGDTNPTEVQIFRETGLSVVAVQHLKMPGIIDGIRNILVFGTARAARKAMRLAITTSSPTVFLVPGIPRATGFEFSSPHGKVSARNVLFAVGRSLYALGVQPVPGLALAPSRAVMAAVASRWYDKIKSFR
jgi:hypothetical protein